MAIFDAFQVIIEYVSIVARILRHLLGHVHLEIQVQQRHLALSSILSINLLFGFVVSPVHELIELLPFFDGSPLFVFPRDILLGIFISL